MTAEDAIICLKHLQLEIEDEKRLLTYQENIREAEQRIEALGIAVDALRALRQDRQVGQ